MQEWADAVFNKYQWLTGYWRGFYHGASAGGIEYAGWASAVTALLTAYMVYRQGQSARNDKQMDDLLAGIMEVERQIHQLSVEWDAIDRTVGIHLAFLRKDDEIRPKAMRKERIKKSLADLREAKTYAFDVLNLDVGSTFNKIYWRKVRLASFRLKDAISRAGYL